MGVWPTCLFDSAWRRGGDVRECGPSSFQQALVCAQFLVQGADVEGQSGRAGERFLQGRLGRERVEGLHVPREESLRLVDQHPLLDGGVREVRPGRVCALL